MAPGLTEARDPVGASPAALEVIYRLGAAEGPLTFPESITVVQSLRP